MEVTVYYQFNKWIPYITKIPQGITLYLRSAKPLIGISSLNLSEGFLVHILEVARLDQ